MKKLHNIKSIETTTSGDWFNALVMLRTNNMKAVDKITEHIAILGDHIKLQKENINILKQKQEELEQELAKFANGEICEKCSLEAFNLSEKQKSIPVDDIQKDAERYRWLRQNAYEHADSDFPYVVVHSINGWGKDFNLLLDGDVLDSTVDKAIINEKKIK